MRGCSNGWKLRQIDEETSGRGMEIVALTETRMKSCSLTIDNYAFFISGHNESSRPNGGVAFLVRKNIKAEFNPVSNRLATLTLQIRGVNVGLMG